MPSYAVELFYPRGISTDWSFVPELTACVNQCHAISSIVITTSLLPLTSSSSSLERKRDNRVAMIKDKEMALLLTVLDYGRLMRLDGHVSTSTQISSKPHLFHPTFPYQMNWQPPALTQLETFRTYAATGQPAPNPTSS
jgi:hypothetical protein